LSNYNLAGFPDLGRWFVDINWAFIAQWLNRGISQK
jgi:hypothetical protein